MNSPAERRMICVVCPQGCRLTATADGEGGWRVSGNRCPRGAVYAREELSDPRRVVTAVVRTDAEELPCVPVRTDKPLPRAMIPELLDRLYGMRVRLPVRCGEVLIADVGGTGVRVVFSGDGESRREG